MSTALFGTDGVRGTPGSYPLDATTIARLGAALAREIGDAPRVLIGRDTRASGDWIERQVAAGVTAAGGLPVTVGVMPTPGVAYLNVARLPRGGCRVGVAQPGGRQWRQGPDGDR